VSDFPLIYVEGTPRELGLQHGRQLKNRIEKVIEFYKRVFKKPESEVFQHAAHFQKLLTAEFPDYATEIEAIAEGAEIDPLWVYAINARSEILTMFVTECTAVFSSDGGILAQNWDWAGDLEELVVLLHITRSDGHRILMLAEPGIIGKMGMNSSGFGVTLNFLYAPGKLSGLPIHVMLRALLDCTDLEQGKKLAEQYAQGKGGNIIWGSADGNYFNLEFANNEFFTLTGRSHMVHTNHYLGNDELNSERERLQSSMQRYARANEMISSFDTVETATQILLDASGDLPICRPYVNDEELGSIGTVCSIVMDLKSKIFHFTPGNPYDHEFRAIDFGQMMSPTD
jgi:isopenicillin-N N-acyltransferase-like protein